MSVKKIFKVNKSDKNSVVFYTTLCQGLNNKPFCLKNFHSLLLFFTCLQKFKSHMFYICL